MLERERERERERVRSAGLAEAKHQEGQTTGVGHQRGM